MPKPIADAIPPDRYYRIASAAQVLRVMLIGSAALALLASHRLPEWAARFGTGPTDLAADWDSGLVDLGLAAPHQAVHDALRRIEQWQPEQK